MTAFEDRTLATTLRLITKYGKTISLVRANAAKVYDPTAGTYTGADQAAEPLKALVQDFKIRIENIGLLLKSGDKEILLAASGLALPTLGDKFSVGSDVYTIVPVSEGGLEVKTVYAGEVAALYKVHGRKS